MSCLALIGTNLKPVKTEIIPGENKSVCDNVTQFNAARLTNILFIGLSCGYINVSVRFWHFGTSTMWR